MRKSPRAAVGNIAGAEDVLDPRQCVIKGSGATYVIHSKIANYEAANGLDLPRARGLGFAELFTHALKRANVLNNFGAGYADPQKTFDMVRSAKMLTREELRSELVDLPQAPNTIYDTTTAEGRSAAVKDILEYARAYEPFMEKLFEIYKKEPKI